MSDDQKLPPRNTPDELHGKTLVIIRRAEVGFGYEPSHCGELRAVGSVVWLDAATGSFPIRPLELTHLEPVTSSNRIPACQGFDYFTVRR